LSFLKFNELDGLKYNNETDRRLKIEYVEIMSQIDSKCKK